MASFNIHLAVAKRYIEKNNIVNIKEFYNGTIDPDLAEYESRLHYTSKTRNKELLAVYLQGKTILPDFLAENEIDNDYNRGVFLHLVTDYIFFADFFDKEYIESITYSDFVKDLYYSYNFVNQYLLDKYEIDLSDFKDKLDINIEKDMKDKDAVEVVGKNILELEKLDLFVDRVSDIDLDKYRMKILENKVNVLPDK